MSQIFGIFRNRNIAKITVPLDSARFFALRPLQYMDFFTFLQVIFLTPVPTTQHETSMHMPQYQNLIKIPQSRDFLILIQRCPPMLLDTAFCIHWADQHLWRQYNHQHITRCGCFT